MKTFGTFESRVKYSVIYFQKTELTPNSNAYVEKRDIVRFIDVGKYLDDVTLILVF